MPADNEREAASPVCGSLKPEGHRADKQHPHPGRRRRGDQPHWEDINCTLRWTVAGIGEPGPARPCRAGEGAWILSSRSLGGFYARRVTSNLHFRKIYLNKSIKHTNCHEIEINSKVHSFVENPAPSRHWGREIKDKTPPSLSSAFSSLVDESKPEIFALS